MIIFKLVGKLLKDALFLWSIAGVLVCSLIFWKIELLGKNIAGVALITAVMLCLMAILLILHRISALYNFLHGRQQKNYLMLKIMLSVFVLGFCSLFFEIFMTIQSANKTLPQNAILPISTMPENWKKRNVEIPGASISFYWHGHLHIFNQNNMRRITPFPAADSNVFRIMIVGDSLTYGYGIGETETYAALLQKHLSHEYRVEVLNLGFCGAQSEDVNATVKKFFKELKPNLVIYGICLNDFLPSGIGEYSNNMTYAVPLPKKFKDYFIKYTKVGEYLDKHYNDILVNMHIRNDFFDDILKDFSSYKKRFAHDLSDMNSFVTTNGAPPVLAMVLDQYPNINGRGFKIAQIAEESAINAGMEIVPITDYYKKYDKTAMAVSKWEGHPNQDANKIFEDMLFNKIIKYPSLEKYRIKK